MTPYFSLILPVYNVASYLKRCVDSILSQSFKDYEIILVDDGSTDDSPLICDAYAEKYSNIHVIHKVNGGLSSARNAGLEQAKGEYVWWIDSDDWIEQGALEHLYNASFEKKPDVVKFHYFRAEKEMQEIPCQISPGIYTGTEAVRNLLNMAFYATGEFLLSAWVHLYRRSFIVKTDIPFISERLVGSEDYLFNLSVLPMAESVCVVALPLYSYYLREGSLAQTYKRDLPARYERLYMLLLQAHQKSGMINQYQKDVSFFYVWHLIRGTCMTQEYQVLHDHSIRDGRRNVKNMLRSSMLREALKHCDRKKLSRKQKVILLAMKLKLESLFYYLFVMKPKSASGI